MKHGDNVKTHIANGVWFSGKYSDDFPDSESILIDNGHMTLIVPKSHVELCVKEERIYLFKGPVYYGGVHHLNFAGMEFRVTRTIIPDESKLKLSR